MWTYNSSDTKQGGLNGTPLPQTTVGGDATQN